jgi:hypothetical protein
MIDRDFLRGFIKLYAFSLAADGEGFSAGFDHSHENFMRLVIEVEF